MYLLDPVAAIEVPGVLHIREDLAPTWYENGRFQEITSNLYCWTDSGNEKLGARKRPRD